MSQKHTFRCFGLTLTESRGYECMVIFLQCSLTLDRDYLTIDDAALLSLLSRAAAGAFGLSGIGTCSSTSHLLKSSNISSFMSSTHP